MHADFLAKQAKAEKEVPVVGKLDDVSKPYFIRVASFHEHDDLLCPSLQPALLLLGGLAISLIALLIVILTGAVGMITSLIGFAYPTYQSFKVH